MLEFLANASDQVATWVTIGSFFAIFLAFTIPLVWVADHLEDRPRRTKLTITATERRRS